MVSETQAVPKWALVTGGSSGLGVEFAKALAGSRYNIVLVARREERLREVREELVRGYGIRAEAIAMDLTAGEAPDRLIRELDERGLDIDVLVNNAGFGIFGSFTEIDWEEEHRMLQLNMVTLTQLTKLFARRMVGRGRGYILQVSSIGAYQPTPTYATYSAAKSYVLNFGQALNYELRNTGVSCTVVSPGVTRTEFLEVAGQRPSLYQRLAMMESDEVARIGVQAMFKRKMSVIPGLFNKLTIWSMRFVPDRVKAALAYVTMTTGQKEVS